MQLVLPWLVPKPRASRPPVRLQVGAGEYAVTIARHRGARRYVLRMTPDGALRLTVPRGASIEAGLAFARRQTDWIAREHERRAARLQPWVTGTAIWFRGVAVPMTCSSSAVTFAAESVALQLSAAGVREAVETHLRAIAAVELPARCVELASLHGLVVTRVSVRNQRSRWGSCSLRGAIALNWRLVQMPPHVSDYIVFHELMHMKQPNHSRTFWREVAAVCPGWREAERWLRKYGRQLLP